MFPLITNKLSKIFQKNASVTVLMSMSLSEDWTSTSAKRIGSVHAGHLWAKDEWSRAGWNNLMEGLEESTCKNTQRNRDRRRGNEEWEERWVREEEWDWGRGQTPPSCPPPPSPMHFLHFHSHFNAPTLACFAPVSKCAHSSSLVQLFNISWMVVMMDFNL